jgi:hypothetical protein
MCIPQTHDTKGLLNNGAADWIVRLPVLALDYIDRRRVVLPTCSKKVNATIARLTSEYEIIKPRPRQELIAKLLKLA